jgi:hypothetical protein
VPRSEINPIEGKVRFIALCCQWLSVVSPRFRCHLAVIHFAQLLQHLHELGEKKEAF